jgi:site-specific DNA recombinase
VLQLHYIVKTKNETVRLRYEEEIEKLPKELELTEEELNYFHSKPMTSEDSVRTVFDFLEKPYEIWCSGNIEDKKLVLRLVFTRGVEYDKKEGFRTASLPLPFRVLGDFATEKCGMVEPRRVELLTSCVQSRRSTN